MHSEGGLCKTIRDSILILFFELIGTALLCSLYNTLLLQGDLCGFLMGTFILLILSIRISGSHYNPAITFAFMIRKDVGKFSRVLGFAYIVFQFIGAFLGALLSFWFNGSVTFIGVALDESKYIPATIVAETLGSMLLCFLYLTQTEEKTKLSKDPAITMFILSACYLACIEFTGSTSVMDVGVCNPAIGFMSALVETF